MTKTPSFNPTAPRPNIMFLQGEDVGLHLHCYTGDQYAITPHLDQLAADGARYTNAFSHSPVCSPSRSGTVTGFYPWTLGTHHHRSRLLAPPRLYTHELRDAGYHVCWPSKKDFNLEPTKGWRDSDEAWWTQPAPKDQPFFVYDNLGETHESRMFPENYPWKHEAFKAIPQENRHDPAKAPIPSYLPDTPEIREQIAAYFDALTYIDLKIGKYLQWLDDNGVADNTIVIFMSDHGRGLPREKRWLYEAGIHMPLLIRWPQQIQPGTVIKDLIGWVDLAPTLLSLAGAAIPSHYQGQIFLGEHQASPRDYVYAGRDRMDHVYDKVRCVRDKQWHYIRNDCPDLPWAQKQDYMEQQACMPVMREMHAKGELQGSEAVFFAPEKPREELYDAVNDPDMVHNLAGDPSCKEELTRLRFALMDHLDWTGDMALITEEDQVESGMVSDWLNPRDPAPADENYKAYRTLFTRLPDHQKCGPEPTPVTRQDYEALH